MNQIWWVCFALRGNRRQCGVTGETMGSFKETQRNEDTLKNELLPAKDLYRYSEWNRAAEKGSIVPLEKLWV